MDRQTIFIVMVSAGLICVVGLAIFIRSRASGRLNRSVSATIIDIRVEASSLSSWWTIWAVWTHPQTGLVHTFRSPHLRYPPKQRIGEHISVSFDAAHPARYRMEL